MADPYLPPAAHARSAAAPRCSHCPKCGETESTKVRYNWWGGALGPKLFHVVRCSRCRAQYNGRTGGSLTKAIIIYQVIAVLVFGTITVVIALNWGSVKQLLFAASHPVSRDPWRGRHRDGVGNVSEPTRSGRVAWHET